MIPSQRRMGMTVQLLGQAVSVYRPLGREKLRTAVAAVNMQALGFCEKYGFVKAGEQNDGGVMKYVMEMDIALR
jgi:probable phosphoglycerate mutase